MNCLIQVECLSTLALLWPTTVLQPVQLCSVPMGTTTVAEALHNGAQLDDAPSDRLSDHLCLPTTSLATPVPPDNGPQSHTPMQCTTKRCCHKEWHSLNAPTILYKHIQACLLHMPSSYA